MELCSAQEHGSNGHLPAQSMDLLLTRDFYLSAVIALMFYDDNVSIVHSRLWLLTSEGSRTDHPKICLLSIKDDSELIILRKDDTEALKM